MKRFLSGLSLCMLFLAGCTKDPLDELSSDEARIYITNHNENIDFSTYNTFRIADSVAVVQNNSLRERARTGYDAAMIEAFAAKMQELGYTRVTSGASADIGIAVSRIYEDYTGVVSYPDYWGGYGGYWDPYYWGYPGYGYYFPGTVGVYSVTEGAVSIDMFDLKNASANNQLNFLWNGLIRGSGTFNEANASKHAQSLVDQSPYLIRN